MNAFFFLQYKTPRGPLTGNSCWESEKDDKDSYALLSDDEEEQDWTAESESAYDLPKLTQGQAFNFLAHVPEAVMSIIRDFVYQEDALPHPVVAQFTAYQFSGMMKCDHSRDPSDPDHIGHFRRWEAARIHMNNELESFTWVELDEHLRSLMSERYSQEEKETLTMGDLRAAVGRLDSDSEHKMDITLLVEFLGLFTDEDKPLCPNKRILTAWCLKFFIWIVLGFNHS